MTELVEAFKLWLLSHPGFTEPEKIVAAALIASINDGTYKPDGLVQSLVDRSKQERKVVHSFLMKCADRKKS